MEFFGVSMECFWWSTFFKISSIVTCRRKKNVNDEEHLVNIYCNIVCSPAEGRKEKTLTTEPSALHLHNQNNLTCIWNTYFSSCSLWELNPWLKHQLTFEDYNRQILPKTTRVQTHMYCMYTQFTSWWPPDVMRGVYLPHRNTRHVRDVFTSYRSRLQTTSTFSLKLKSITWSLQAVDYS